VLLADYGHFLSIAAKSSWDERALGLRRDAEVWPQLGEDVRRRVSVLLAGFCIGEAAVADQLEPFARADSRADRSACFRAQAEDEARHARFFDRVAAEVVRVPGRAPGDRREALRRLLEPRYRELFELRLPAATQRLAADRAGLGAAVALYHMVLEGLVFTAGQLAMLALLDGLELPGLRRGLELVLRDERWHLGFGARALQDLGLDEAALEHLLGDEIAALEAWGDVLDDATAERVAVLHRRRLRAAGLAPPAPLTDGRTPAAAGAGLLDRLE
jgi:ribonucleoside-diphosphate reductase beta chain